MVATSDSLQRAIKHHEAGELEQAESLYRDIIRIDPGHVDALHLLGVAAHQKADHRTGADYIRQAIVKGANSPLTHSNLGACYRSMNRIPEAIAEFREAVRLQPGFVGGRYNLAMALEATGLTDEAIAEYREVLRIEPGFIQALNNLASLFATLDRFDDAIAHYRKAIAARPNSAEFRYNLANVLSRSGRCEEAVHEYRESIRLNPNLAEAHNNLATALNSLERHAEALSELAQAIHLRPDYAEARVNQAAVEEAIRQKRMAVEEPQRMLPVIPLPVNASPRQWCERGTQLQNTGLFEDAATCFQRAIEIDPNFSAAYFGLGFGLLTADKCEEAGRYYEQGLLIDDTNASAWNNLGSIYTHLENWNEAIACYESALQIDAAHAKAHYNLGNVYKDLGQPPEASACYRRALYVDPNMVEAHINLGVVLQQQGRLKEALASQTRAVDIRSDDPVARFHRAVTYLLNGDLETGWDEYSWRWRYDTKPRDFPFPVWDGRDLSQKKILVYFEQGVGDEILFASCLPDVLDTAAQCLVECDPRLVPLIARSFPLADVVARTLSIEDARAYGVDVQISAGSLPGLMRRRLEAFPRRQRYLAACPHCRAQWRERYARLGTGLIVGISWRGGSEKSTKRRRSTTLAQWKNVFAVPGVQFVNLQYGDCAAELDAVKQSEGITLHHWADADPLKDLEGFSAQVAELDLVISIDNATVHMAGALGVPVWTLLHFAPNWRWMLDRQDSPWYRSMQLVRQPEFGKWEPVFETVSEQLQLLATSQGSKTTFGNNELLARMLAPTSVHSGSSASGAVKPSSSLPPLADPQAAEERAKYEQIWRFDQYRKFSPGAAAIEKVSLVDTLRKNRIKTVLDAGCGSGKLMWRLIHEYPGEFEVHGFDITDNCLDPCFAEMKDQVLTLGCLWNPDDFTKIYDAVICCDVMEHIPTERVPAVLENLRKSTRRLAFFSISVVPDSFGPMLIGEALHLTVKQPNWWFAKLALAGFKIATHSVGVAKNGREAQLYVYAGV